jgi:hypothetical protein
MFGLRPYDGVGRGDVVPKEKRTGWSSARAGCASALRGVPPLCSAPCSLVSEG